MKITNENAPVRDYIVGFIDLLGQRELFINQSRIPKFSSVDEEARFRSTLRESVGVAIGMQDMCRNIVESYNAKLQMNTSQNASPALLKYQCWSDGFVYFSEVDDDPQSRYLKNACLLLAAVGTLCLLGLSNGKPLRGGVDIAWAVEARENEIYGCAVAKAYELESTKADYPRIVVGSNVLEYFSHHMTSASESNRKYAKIAIGLITKDTDDQLIIDYLGHTYREHLGGPVFEAARLKAVQFVSDSLEAWRKGGNEKLATRYEKLMRYIDQHKPC